MATDTSPVQPSDLPEPTVIFAVLRDALAYLYSDPQDARAVVDDARL